ncbi:glycosyltransferase family 4 protein [Nemorincola caseinilytica]|uniref:Glycosyltransferase family 4 protein n=1 Tax=Nemorincola caseinilytica TaxID=2054315 RepID=A0ABP8NG58_9BACT
MKILILTGNYPRKGGLNNGIFIHQQVKALLQLGAECHVLLLHNWYPRFGLHKYHPYWQQGHDLRSTLFHTYEGVPIHHVPMFVRMPGRLFPETHYDRAARAIVKYIKGHAELQGADLLYAHFMTDNAFIAAKVKDILGLQLAAIARGDDIHAWPEQDPSLRDNLTYVFRHADLLLANSGRLATDARKWMQPGNMREVGVVYNGVNTEAYRPVTDDAEKMHLREKYGLHTGTRYLICVATPVALKGWHELLAAVKALGSDMDGWELLMVAHLRDHHDTIDLAAKEKEPGLTGKVRYIPGMRPADLAELFRVCDIFVLPSYNEGMANAVLEAMASGIAVVATDVGGHSEVIENGVDGMLIRPRSEGELTEAMRTLMRDEALRSSMGTRACARMLRFGDYLQNGRRLLDIFTQHLATRGKRS